MRIALIGFGEVGQIIAEDLRSRQQTTLRAWDVLFSQIESVAMRIASNHNIVASDCADAVKGAEIVVSMVTPGQCAAAARQVAESIEPGTYFLDLNSVAPRAKRDAASAIEAGGGRFVEAAVMAPIAPKRIASPMLLGGPHASEFAPLARRLGFFGASFYSADIGKASAAKMCRSVVIKGMESLLTESLLAARHHGVEREVIGSIQNLLPGADWTHLSRYMISRSLMHGRRRAEEMHEAASTVRDSGIDPRLSLAIAHRQHATAATGVDPESPSLEAMLDAMLRSDGESRC